MSQTPAYTYRATVVRVIDGDTFEFEIDLGFKVSTRQHIRVLGFNAPEMHTAEGRAMQRQAADLLNRARVVIVRTNKSVPAQSFERYVADVWIDGQRIADVLRAGQEQTA